MLFFGLVRCRCENQVLQSCWGSAAGALFKPQNPFVSVTCCLSRQAASRASAHRGDSGMFRLVLTCSTVMHCEIKARPCSRHHVARLLPEVDRQTWGMNSKCVQYREGRSCASIMRCYNNKNNNHNSNHNNLPIPKQPPVTLTAIGHAPRCRKSARRCRNSAQGATPHDDVGTPLDDWQKEAAAT